MTSIILEGITTVEPDNSTATGCRVLRVVRVPGRRRSGPSRLQVQVQEPACGVRAHPHPHNRWGSERSDLTLCARHTIKAMT